MIIGIDTETTGLDYTRNHIIGLACATEKQATYKRWDAVAKEKLRRTLMMHQIVEHNAKFDTHMLRWDAAKFATPPKLHDTMVLTFLLDETGSHALEPMAKKYLGVEPWKRELLDWLKQHKLDESQYDKVPAAIIEPYAKKDVAYTRDLFLKTQPMLAQRGVEALYATEMEVLQTIVDVEERGVLMDVAYLKTLDRELEPQERKLERKIHRAAGHKFNILSEDELIEVIYTTLGLPIIERSFKTQKPATDKETLKKLKHPICDAVAEYRLIHKLRSTYCQPLCDRTSDGILRCNFDQNGARTGRFSSYEPNLQNIPKTHDIRRGFITRPGYYNFYFDYNQMEMIIYAFFSRDPKMIDDIRNNRDLHDEKTADYYGTREFTKTQRDTIKTINFGIIYGMGARGLSKKLDITKNEAWAMLNRYYQAFPAMKKFNQDTGAKAALDGYIVNPFGRRRKISPEKGYVAVNTLVQGTCSDILKVAMNRGHRLLRGSKSGITMTIHDELVVEVHESELDLVPEFNKCMTAFEQFDLPLKTKISYTKTNWLDKVPYEGKGLTRRSA